MSVSKTKDGYICFNAACGASGTLLDLVGKVTGRNAFEATRFILNHSPSEQDNFEEDLTIVLSDTPEFTEFSQETLDRMHKDILVPGNPGMVYMNGRGFTDDTVEKFKIGYSAKRNMVAVPVHSANGIPVGVVGRSITGKAFKNSVGLPTSKVFFNLHRAKRIGSTVIVVESSFDAMSVYQSGFPNVVACLGTAMSDEKYNLLARYFDRIILFVDNRDYDVAGKAYIEKMIKRLGRHKEILLAQYSWKQTYPGDLKDATDILESHGEEAVAQCINNAISHFEYAGSMV
jgi:DNA primase